MPRRARITLAGVPLHLIQRGNNRQVCFFAREDYKRYLDWLCEYAEECRCEIHAYVLMTNHVHLLITPHAAGSAGTMMKRLGQRYVQYVNRRYRRSGTLWEGRFRSCLTREEEYVLGCYRYIELNPVRANMVGHPAEYAWSSYRFNAQGEHSIPLVEHPVYTALGDDLEGRRAAYRELFRYHLDSGIVDQIRSATNGNYALGSERFRREIATTLARRAEPGKSGRPRKARKGGIADLAV